MSPHRASIWNAVLGILGSKKAIMALLSLAVWVGAKVGLKLDANEVYPMVAPLWLAILAQGAADVGKSKALIEAAQPAPVEPPKPAA